jgi:hypothetical protein
MEAWTPTMETVGALKKTGKDLEEDFEKAGGASGEELERCVCLVLRRQEEVDSEGVVMTLGAMEVAAPSMASEEGESPDTWGQETSLGCLGGNTFIDSSPSSL